MKARLKYGTLPSHLDGKKIFFKIDSLAVVFNYWTMYEVLDFLRLSTTDEVAELFGGAYKVEEHRGVHFDMQFNGCMFEITEKAVWEEFRISDHDIFLNLDQEDVFTTRFSYIRFSGEGKALDYLRSLGFKFEEIVLNGIPDNYLECNEVKVIKDLDGSDKILNYEKDYHFTRVDYTFDFINYAGTFVNDIKFAAEETQNDNGRIPILGGAKSGCTWQHKSGDQNTFYFGAAGSDVKLRCYDKKMEMVKKKVFEEQCPYYDIDEKTGESILPDTWIRIEYQCRKPKHIESINLSCDSGEQVLKWIYEHYAIRESFKSKNIVACWDHLFNWEEIPLIIQNANTVKVVDVIDRATTNIKRNIRALLVYISKYGFEGLFSVIKSELDILNEDNIKYKRRSQRIRSDILACNNGVYGDYIDYVENKLIFKELDTKC